MIQDTYKKLGGLGLGLSLLALCAGCSAEDPMSGQDTVEVFLQPAFHVNGVETRSIVSGIATTEGEGKIHQVKLFVTKENGYTPYDGVGTSGADAGLSTFTYQSASGGGNEWVGSPIVKLSSVKARIYAYSPASSTLTKSTSTMAHTIPITLPAAQSFHGAKEWDSDAIDYMYGSAANTVGDATAITASHTSPSGSGSSAGTYQPEIYLQHALARLSFTMHSATGRPVNTTYDYVKKIKLKAGTNLFTTGSGTMSVADGAIGGGTPTSELTFTAKEDAGATTAVLCGNTGTPAMVGYGLVAPLSTASDMTITVVVGQKGSATADRELSATLKQIVWKRGHTHKIQITLSNRAVTVSTEIMPWTDSDMGNGDVKPGGY